MAAHGHAHELAHGFFCLFQGPAARLLSILNANSPRVALAAAFPSSLACMIVASSLTCTRVNLTRYYGILAPNHRWRGLVTPAKRGKGVKRISNDEVRSAGKRHAARACPALSGMTWAQRLKRVFNIDIEICGRCGGAVKVIADASDRCIEDQEIIDKILAHLRDRDPTSSTLPLLIPPSRATPETLPIFAWKGAR